MARLVLTESFLNELADLSDRAADEVLRKLALVESFPGVGSSVTNSLLLNSFGSGGLKVSAAGYDVFYKRVPTGDDELVYVVGLLHQRRIR